jgi:hypothetical protein
MGFVLDALIAWSKHFTVAWQPFSSSSAGARSSQFQAEASSHQALQNGQYLGISGFDICEWTGFEVRANHGRYTRNKGEKKCAGSKTKNIWDFLKALHPNSVQ